MIIWFKFIYFIDYDVTFKNKIVNILSVKDY